MKELHLMDRFNVEAVVKGIAKDDAKKTAELMEAFFTQPLDHLNESVGYLVEQVVDNDFIKDLISKDPVRVEMDELVRQIGIVLFLPLNRVKEYDLVIGGLLASAVAKYASDNKDALKLAGPMFDLLSDAGQVKQLMTFDGVRYADRVINLSEAKEEPKKADNKKHPKAEKKEKPKEKKVDPELTKAVNYESIPKKLRIVIEKGFEDAKIKENILALVSKAGKPLYYDAKASKDGLLVLKQVDEQANTYALELPYTSEVKVEADKASA
jgi:hypothetical protein